MTNTYVALNGQLDNIGDSVLRRPLLATARVTGVCHIYIGENAHDYAANLGVLPGDVLYVDRRQWMRSLVKSAITRRTNFFLNAGEITVNRKFAWNRRALLPVVLALKARSGISVQAGIGIRNTSAHELSASRDLARNFSLVTWRDPESQRSAGVGDVYPDWAMAEGSSLDVLKQRFRSRATQGARRRNIVVCLRGDRSEPDAAWIAGLGQLAQRLDASITVVTQVRRDQATSTKVAHAVSAANIDWPEEIGHRDQENRARDAYAHADWVVSDRLHGLIMAMTEGAIPLPILPDTSGKLARTMAGLGVDFTFTPAESIAEITDQDLAAQQSAHLEILRNARRAIINLESRIVRLNDFARARVSGR